MHAVLTCALVRESPGLLYPCLFTPAALRTHLFPRPAGKVLSLHNGDGRVLWQLDFGPTAPTTLVEWLTPSDPEEGVEVSLAVVNSCRPPILKAVDAAVCQTLLWLFARLWTWVSPMASSCVHRTICSSADSAVPGLLACTCT